MLRFVGCDVHKRTAVFTMLLEDGTLSAHLQLSSEHLTCCSPCFNRYMEILANLKRRKAAGQ